MVEYVLDKETLDALLSLQRELKETEQILAGRLETLNGQLKSLIDSVRWQIKD